MYSRVFEKQARRKFYLPETSSHELQPCFRVLHSYSTHSRRVTLMRFPSLWRMLGCKTHFPQAYLTQYVPLPGFLNLPAAFFFTSIPVLFHTGSAFGISPFRAFSFREAAIPLEIHFLPDVCIILHPPQNLRFP